ncbi:MAG: molybdenum cofactor guanylyltransferase [Thermodesulfobacteriota bacterium]
MTGALLAGGQSRRMGTNKAFIEVDGITIIERVLGVLNEVFTERLIIADEVSLFSGLGARTIPDAYKGAGSLGGIYTALLNSASDTVFVTACDMPDIKAEAVRRVISTPLNNALAVVPFIDGKAHPMHALYHRDCLEAIKEMITSGNLRITEFLESIEVKRLFKDDFKGIDIQKSVANINTVEELRNRGRGG